MVCSYLYPVPPLTMLTCTSWKRMGYHAGDLGTVLPTSLFALFQVLALAASAGICWWLIIRKGQNLGGWLGRFLQRRSSFAVCCIGLCVLSFLAYAASAGLQVLAIQSSESAFNETVISSNISQRLIVWPIQVIAMVAVTLMLARNRVSARKV